VCVERHVPSANLSQARWRRNEDMVLANPIFLPSAFARMCHYRKPHTCQTALARSSKLMPVPATLMTSEGLPSSDKCSFQLFRAGNFPWQLWATLAAFCRADVVSKQWVIHQHTDKCSFQLFRAGNFPQQLWAPLTAFCQRGLSEAQNG